MVWNVTELLEIQTHIIKPLTVFNYCHIISQAFLISLSLRLCGSLYNVSYFIAHNFHTNSPF